MYLLNKKIYRFQYETSERFKTTLYGLFLASDDEIKELYSSIFEIDSYVFEKGEIKGYIELVSDDLSVVVANNSNLWFGYNPLDYI